MVVALPHSSAAALRKAFSSLPGFQFQKASVAIKCRKTNIHKNLRTYKLHYSLLQAIFNLKSLSNPGKEFIQTSNLSAWQWRLPCGLMTLIYISGISNWLKETLVTSNVLLLDYSFLQKQSLKNHLLWPRVKNTIWQLRVLTYYYFIF